MANFYAFYPSSSASANPSVGPNGQPIPSDATLVAGENPSGNLQPLQTDSSGSLLVTISTEPTTPLNVNLTEVGGAAVTLGQKANAASIPVTLSTTQEADLSSIVTNTGTTATNTTGLNLTITAVGGSRAGDAVAISGFNGTAMELLALDPSSNLFVNVATSVLPTGASTSANQTNGTQKTQIVDGSGNVIASTSNALDVSVTNTVPVSGTVAVTQSTTPWVVGQGTASALNATVVGLGTAGAPSGGVVSIQGVGSGTAVPVSGTVTATNSANANTGGAVPAQATQVGGTDGTDLRALSVDSTGKLNVNNISGTVSLPTLASTSTKQSDGSQKTQIVDGSGNVIASTSNALNVDVTNTVATTGSTTITGTVIGNTPIQNVYSSTNITTGAYVQLVASTTNVINTLHIFDSSGQAMILGIGGSGSEVTTLYVPPGGDIYTLHIPAGSRLAYKALTSTASSGYLLMSFLE